MAAILGLHHMTAICGPAQENIDFYCGVLGLRLVKLTVNFDDPSAYHLYYGDGQGTPGTILTFFPYPDGYPGRPGRGQATVTSLAIPKGALNYWVDRFKQNEVEFDKPQNRPDRQSVSFRAPDGLPFELIVTEYAPPFHPWEGSRVPGAKAITGMQSVTLAEDSLERTEAVLTGLLGLEKVSSEGDRHVYGCGNAQVVVSTSSEAPPSRSGHGSVHHIAFRVADEEAQLEMRETLSQAGLHVSPVMNRTYFKSIYFREPGGILFEIATDGPGFAVDEPTEALGTSLQLPPHFQALRTKIERALPELRLPRS